MAAAEDEEPGAHPAGSKRRKRFVTPAPNAAAAGDQTEAAPHPELDPPPALMSRRTMVGGAAMATTAVVCFALTIGFSGNGNGANDAAAHQVSSLREQIRLAAAKTDALPKATDAARGLVTAQTSADHVASLQNDYRYLTPRATADGALDTDATASIRRNLAPYFAPSAGQDALGPWYLLASDRNVPAGAGIPMSFDSGFTWIAERPYTVTEDGTVRITWLAVETRPAAGRTAQVYAWAQADFDLTRTTFTTAQTGTTALGESLRMAVIRS